MNMQCADRAVYKLVGQLGKLVDVGLIWKFAVRLGVDIVVRQDSRASKNNTFTRDGAGDSENVYL